MATRPPIAALDSISFNPEKSKIILPLPDDIILKNKQDVIGELNVQVPDEALKAVIEQKLVATTHIYRALDKINIDLQGFFHKITDTLPSAFDGLLFNPDGNPAQSVAVEVQPPVYSAQELTDNPDLKNVAWVISSSTTDARGGFKVNLPSVPIPSGGMTLRVRGSNDMADISVSAVKSFDGHLGTLPLSKSLTPIETSIITQLKGIQSDIMALSAADVINKPSDFASPSPKIQLGEGDCGRDFRSNSGVIDRFRYSVMIRLVEPQMNQWEPIFRMNNEAGTFNLRIPGVSDDFWKSTGAANGLAQLNAFGTLVLVNRHAIDRPIDVSEFHRATEESPVFLPKASTLGLGYVVHMHQTWIPAGLSLGDLLYSLPLAPGEQQRIAIEERSQTITERDAESFSESEFQTFNETQDSSALATFQSAFREAAHGGSSMQSNSHTENVGATASTGIVGAIFGGGGISAGYGNSSSSGSTNSWQNTSRDFTSSAAQDMHSSLGRVASSNRSGNRTRVRVATSNERAQVTTRVVTNHNHNHALTMQWWEVLRHFAVTSEVDDVQLVCFVPLELIQFLPPGQPYTLSAVPPSRDSLVGTFGRYRMLLRYYDVLLPYFYRNSEFMHGMRLLKQFAADWEAQPQTTQNNSDVINISLQGTFFRFEEIFVSVITRSGARLGPMKLMVQPNPPGYEPTPEIWPTRADLLNELKRLRLRSDSPVTLSATLALPDWLQRHDIIRLEISRRFTSYSYRLKAPSFSSSILSEIFSFNQQLTVSFNPDELERELGGPILQSSSNAKLSDGTNLMGANSFFTGEQLPGNLPVPTLRIASILSYNDLLRIETVFHHVVRNTVTYSKTVWGALTAEERAILLERYTIGVPQGGLAGADQEVPLLNCVANQFMGFFGNAAIMPFSIPPQVAASMKVTSRDIQDALLKFHRQAFQAPKSSITLPTRGTLGEAILGSCNSSEKIDLTRFWNWQDSPSDQADSIPQSVFQPAQALQFSAGSGGASVGAATPGSSGSIISINSGAPALSNPDIIGKLIDKAPNLQEALNLTGLDTLQKQISADTTSASAGRKEAVDSVTSIQTQAMKSAESIVKSVADAAATVMTGGASSAAGAAKGGKDGGGGGAAGGG